MFAGLAKDFVTGNPQSVHMVGTQSVDLFGRPFPLFVQSYLGAVKSWLTMPSLLVLVPALP